MSLARRSNPHRSIDLPGGALLDFRKIRTLQRRICQAREFHLAHS